MSIAQQITSSTHTEDSIELVLVQAFINNITYASSMCMVTTIIVWATVAYFFPPHIGQIVWLSSIVFVFSFGYCLTWYSKRRPLSSTNYLSWRLTITVYCIFCGLAWGVAPAWMIWQRQFIDVALLIAMLLAVCSVSVSLTVSERNGMWCFLITTLTPPALALLPQIENTNAMVGVVLVSVLVLMMITGNKAHQSLRSQFVTEMKLRSVVTEASLAREQAEKASTFKSQFLANISHEIRTPMNAVLGMLKLLQSTELSDRQLDYTLKGEGAANALLGLLNDVLDFSKMEAGKVILDVQPLSIKQLMQDLMVILQANASHKKLHIHFDIDPRAPKRVLGDAMRLRQVLINLTSNAIKFTERGHVLLRLQLLSQQGTSARLRFAVEDTGIGIAPDKQSCIFEEFTQAENTIARRFGGTGLGLSISQQLVKAMGGSIHVQSTLGVGSTFSFELLMQTFVQLSAPELAIAPSSWPNRAAWMPNDTQELLSHEDDADADLDAPAHRPSKCRLAGMRLLVVEDNLLNQQIALELLALEGAVVEVADHGAQGIEVLTQSSIPFDAVLLDLQMPNMDGFAVTRVIRNELKMYSLPIIAMTANAMESDRQACLDAGMNAHISKPFNIDFLVAVLKEYQQTTTNDQLLMAYN